MKIALEALVVALAVVSGMIPGMWCLARRFGGRSPGEAPSRVHRPAGAIGICGGFLAAMWVLHLTVPGAAALRAAPSHVLGVVLGGAAMCAVGVIVDTGAVRAVHRLALQTGAATFAYACGFRILAVHVPFVGDLDTSAGALPFTVLWIVGVINIVGLMDGLEGLAVGVTFFAAATNLTVALLSEAPLPALLSGALTGAALGALIHTQRSARVQVRDAHRAGGTLGATGSYFAGYVLATTALCALQKTSTAVSLVVPILALGVPIFDTLFAMVRCVLERRSLFSPDREHIHHRLVDMGITRGRAVLIIYAFCAVFTVVAIGASMERTWHVGAALFAASVALVGLARFVGYFDHIIRAPSRVRALPLEAELLRRAFPRLPRRLADATSEAQLFEALERFAQEAGLCFTEVLETRSGSGARCLRSWSQAEDAPNKRERGGATTYPLGGGGSRAAVQFGLRCEEVPPQAEILLQIAADLLTQHLLRLRSALTLVDEPTTEHEAPAVLDIPARPSRV